MGKRVTIVISDENLKKLRLIQAKKIKESETTVSFSSIVNQQLQKSFK